MWINNPSPDEAEKAVAAGAIACTTNPAYAAKMHQNPTEKARIEKDADEAIRLFDDDDKAASAIQRAAVKRLLRTFMPIYKSSGKKLGFVSIQISPFGEEDPDKIVAEAHENLKLGENIIAKIPTTVAGLAAMKVLMEENVPIIATEIMGISQAVAVCEMYREIASRKSIDAPLFVTHISGIFDDHLKAEAVKSGAAVSKDLLYQAGCAVARKQYALMKERNYPGILLGGGARGLHHFTEMVGGTAHVTINWKGSAETLIQEDPPVVWRMETPVPDYVVYELEAAFPDFRKAYGENGLKPDEFADFGPVVLFRNMFIEGWKYLLNLVSSRRKIYAK
jgi:transaldolase